MGEAPSLTAGDHPLVRRPLLLAFLALALAAPVSAADKPKAAALAGTLTARTATAVTVKDGAKTLTCALGASSPAVASFKVGDRVRIGCLDGVLAAIARVAAPPSTAPSVQTAVGTIATLADGSVTVKTDGGSLTCTVSSAQAAGLNVGDRVKIGCTNGVVTGIAKLDAPRPPDPSVRTESGTIAGLTDGALTLQLQNGTLTCTRDAKSPALGDFHVGDKVKVACTNGVLTAIAKLDAPPTTPSPTAKTGVGTVTAASADSLTVQTDGGAVTCKFTADWKGLRPNVGDKVKFACTNDVLYALAAVEQPPPPPTPVTTKAGAGTVSAVSNDSLTVQTDGGAVTCKFTADWKGLRPNVGDRVKFACANDVLYSLARL